MRRTARVVALVVLFAVAFAAAWIRLPYYAVGPGPANDVAPLIDVQDVPRYPSEGKLIMTTVRCVCGVIITANPFTTQVGSADAA